MLHSQFNCRPSKEGNGFYWNLTAVVISVEDGHLSTAEIVVATSGQNFGTEEECRRQMLLAKAAFKIAD